MSLRLSALLAAACLLALAAAAPAPTTDRPAIPRPVTTITEEDLEDSPWFSFPLFGNLFAPLWRLLPSFGDIGPRIVADDDKFKVIVNVKDYKKDDLKVKVKGDFILVQGTHEAKQDDHDMFASQFFHTYTLPANSSGSDVTAELTSDGYLVVNAPLSGPVNRAKDDKDREVSIVETGAPLPKEETTSTTSSTSKQTDKSTTTSVSATSAVSTASAVSEDDDDRKEPTTPVPNPTDKDNNIPHGNEIPL